MGLTDKLDELMEKRGINKGQLAKESNIPYTTIDGLYKKGSDNVKLTTLRKLAEYFKCSLDYLVDDDHPYAPDEIKTIAAHHSKEDWTEEELDEVERFKEWVRSKRK